ncbi:M4 family metallopeptidase [Streptomyces boncukensis]|uniref:M4 family metallopeptidase n=1 Tax=Streptomyces boncukensis TaxID=2711219 RepID=UPI0030B9F8A9
MRGTSAITGASGPSGISAARKRALRGGALVATAALLVAAVETGTAVAGEGRGGDSPATVAGTLGLGAKEKLIRRDVVKDPDGTTHTRYDRTYAGMPVIGGDLIVHRSPSGAVSVTKATKRRIAVDTTEAAGRAAESAGGTARKAARAQEVTGAKAGKPARVVWAVKGAPRLALRTVVRGTQEDGSPSRLHVFTDAESGRKLAAMEERQGIVPADQAARASKDGARPGKSAQGAQGGKGAQGKPAAAEGEGTAQYSGSVALGTTGTDKGYTLTDGTRGKGRTTDLGNTEDDSGQGTAFYDDDNKWGGGRQTAAVDAHYGAAATWDYYKKAHGRNGIKNDGKGALSRVHYGKGYVNAFWSDSCFCMTYGDGEGDAKPLTSLDVAAHEMSHGVTSATANLVYQGESGGLNEATSDIFATAAEFHADNAADPGDYLIGEKIDINGDGTPLRYMDKPSRDGESLDSWSPEAGDADVHYSSGIANHFFYLLSEGSGKKTIGDVTYDSPTADGSDVKGIGRDKAAQIWYKALTAYMTSTTDYQDARTATLKAAADLYGKDSTEAEAVGAAWTGVNVT